MRDDRFNVDEVAHDPSCLCDSLIRSFDMNSEGVVTGDDLQAGKRAQGLLPVGRRLGALLTFDGNDVTQGRVPPAPRGEGSPGGLPVSPIQLTLHRNATSNIVRFQADVAAVIKEDLPRHFGPGLVTGHGLVLGLPGEQGSQGAAGGGTRH